MASWRKCKLVLVVFFLFGFGILLLTFDTAFYQQPRQAAPGTPHEHIQGQSSAKVRDTRTRLFTILFTTRPGTNSTRFPGVDDASKLCPRCKFTHDQRLWNQSDAVLFNGFFLPEQPPYKPPGQIWVYYFREAPPRLSKPSLLRLKKYRGFFNWMMTYRRASDVYMPYARLTTDDPAKFNRKKALASFRNKTGNAHAPVAWIVSHCKTDSKRELLVEKLAKLVPIDVYGDCGPLKCKTSRQTSVGGDCRMQLSHKYKFYLAFENCLCQEYVTEKFFDVLSSDMVPIVYSRANYTALGIPAASFINVADYETVEELAERILWLAEHPEEYVDFLKARAGVKTVREGWPVTWCRICDKLTNLPVTEYHAELAPAHEDVQEWLNRPASGDGGPVCVPPPEIATGS